MSYFVYLENALTPLQFPDKPEIGFSDLLALSSDMLSDHDKRALEKLRMYFDILNIRSLYLGYPIDPKGNLSKEELEKALDDQVYFDQAIFEVLEKSDEPSEKVKLFPKVLKTFFDARIENEKGFLKWYFELEKYSRLILTAFRCKKLGRDVSEEINFEDPLDPIVSEIVSQKDSPHFDPPSEYEDLVEVVQVEEDNVMDQYASLTAYRIRKIQEKIETKNYCLSWFLGYIAVFSLLEEYHNTNSSIGANVLNKMMKDE